MTTYRVQLHFGSFLFRADFAQARCSIEANYDEDEDDDSWEPTPFQVADACHCEREAARSLMRSECGRGWYAAPDDHRTDDEILDELMATVAIKELKT